MSLPQALTSFLVGLLFSLGLGISGMVRPDKVLGFLDITGAWDPSLMFVMIGAIGTHAIAYPLIRRRSKPVFDTTFHVPEKKKIDWRLLAGASIFGLGWGLAGYCPGPVLVAVASFEVRPILFVMAMGVGMMIYQFSFGRMAQKA